MSQQTATGTAATGSNTYDSLIYASAAKYGVDPLLVKAVIKQESGGRQYKSNGQVLTSSAGAIGIMQLMPGTAKGLGVNPYDVAQNIDGGVKLLAQNIKAFGSIPLALAAYNAGGGAVKKYGGIPPYAETQNYVKSIMSIYKGGNVSLSADPNAGSSSSAGTDGTSTDNGTGFAQGLFAGIVQTILLIGLLILGVVFFMKSFDVNVTQTVAKVAKTAALA
jgi:soluble lytic murein transglycosylase-like protein